MRGERGGRSSREGCSETSPGTAGARALRLSGWRATGTGLDTSRCGLCEHLVALDGRHNHGLGLLGGVALRAGGLLRPVGLLGPRRGLGAGLQKGEVKTMGEQESADRGQPGANLRALTTASRVYCTWQVRALKNGHRSAPR